MTDNLIDILLIEDNPTDAELTIRALKKNNIANKIHLIVDGEEALDFFYARNKYAGRDVMLTPKVVILDLKLPKVEGLEILKKVKADERLKLIPIVILTSSKEERDVIESYNLGANSYIVKPVDFKKFADSIRDLGMYWCLLNQSPV